LVGILVPRLRFHRRPESYFLRIPESARGISAGIFGLLVQFLVLVHHRYLMPAASVKKIQFGDVEIIVANIEISNDNC
jgi:hypothetical protein